MGMQFEPTAGEEEVAGAEGAGAGGGHAADEGAEEADKTKSVEGGESDSLGGEEAGEAGKDGEEAEGEIQQKAGAETDVTSDQLSTLKAEIIKELGGGKEESSAPENVLQKVSLPEMNEQILGGLAERFKISEESMPMFREVAPVFTSLMNHAIGKIVNHFQGEFSGMQYEKALEGLSKTKGFEDIPALRKGIDGFMEAFAPQNRSNPKLLDMAVKYARGLNVKAQIKAAAAGAERKTTIIGKSKTSSPSGGAGGAAPMKLTASQESASEMYPGGRAAYVKHLRSRDGARTLEPAAR